MEGARQWGLAGQAGGLHLKLPVFRTVGQTFGFVVERRFFSLLRLIWLPTFLSVALSAVIIGYQFSAYGFPPTPARMEAMQNDHLFTALQWIEQIIGLVLSAMIAISVHRMILLDDVQKGVYFYWRLTREEWLYIAAWIGYFILVAIAFALPIAGHLYWVTTHEHVVLPHWHAMTAANEIKNLKIDPLFQDPRWYIVGFMSVLFGLIALARFGLVFPIIVAEGRLSFWRSWVVTRGNFLRLVGFWIVTVVLTYVLCLVMAAIAAFAVIAMVAGLAGGQSVGAFSIVVFAVPAAVSLGIYLVVCITIFIAAMSFSYKALSGEGDAHAEHEAEAA
jgi:hypothetical protein